MLWKKKMQVWLIQLQWPNKADLPQKILMTEDKDEHFVFPSITVNNLQQIKNKFNVLLPFLYLDHIFEGQRFYSAIITEPPYSKKKNCEWLDFDLIHYNMIHKFHKIDSLTISIYLHKINLQISDYIMQAQSDEQHSPIHLAKANNMITPIRKRYNFKGLFIHIPNQISCLLRSVKPLNWSPRATLKSITTTKK